MDTLRIRWAGGEAVFAPGTTVRVGRDVDAEVQLRNTNVSRHHVEVTYSPSGWVLRDVGSAQGTWRDGRQVETVTIRGTVQVTLGREGPGEVLTLEASPSVAGSPNATELPGNAASGATQIVGGGVPHGAPASGGGGEGTLVVGAVASNRPGGALRAEAIAGATVVTGDVLNIECAGRSYSFQPGQVVSIGRDAQCDIVSNNPTVSRRHAHITHDGSAWKLHDEGSAGGTYIDGKRITEQQLAGSVGAWLGDATTGERLVLVASGTNPATARKRRRRQVPVALAVVGLVFIGFIGWIVTKGGGEQGPSNDQLGRATVRLIAGDFSGSGTVVDAEQGLILTNAHVVAPDAVGSAVRDVAFDFQLVGGPREVEVLVAPGLGKAAEPRFFAEVVAVDGYLDLAVLKITKTFVGQLIEPGSGDLDDLVSVAVDDSTDLSSGDPVRVFGYPGAAQSLNVTFSEGIVSGPVKNERLASNRGMLNITAPIFRGNSGGLAANAAGELVGIPSLIRDDSIPSMRPSAFAVPLIEAARKGERYTSPFYWPLASEEIDAASVKVVAPANAAGIKFDCSTGELVSIDNTAVGVSFTFKGFVVDQHQDLMVVVWIGDDLIGLWTLDEEFPVKWPVGSGCATITVPIDTSAVADATAPLTVTLGLGPGYSTDG